MQWPETTAAVAGAAGFEAGSAAGASRSVAASVAAAAGTAGNTMAPGAGPLGSQVMISGVPGGRGLPCTEDPELFFAESPQDVEYAKALCRACPVRMACLSGALERREPWGVWGGELFLRGEVVPRKRPRGRPRKTDVAA